MLKPLVKRCLFLALIRWFLPPKMGTLDFLGISPPRNQLTTKIRFWVQRAPSQSLPVKLEVRSGNQEEKKKEKKHAWVEHFTPTPKRRPFTYTFLFVHVGWGHRRNHPCQVSSQSVHQFRLRRGSKFTMSHRLGEWLLQQCYALTCYTVINITAIRQPRPVESLEQTVTAAGQRHLVSIDTSMLIESYLI